VDAFGLRKGMNISATKIVTVPEDVVSQQQKVTGQMAPPPQVEAIQGPVLIETNATEPEPAEVAEAKPPEAQKEPKTLPNTASELPSVALIGALMLLSGVVGLVVWSRRQRPGF
jgi:LPXTG-motif cell wall-anchored protein